MNFVEQVLDLESTNVKALYTRAQAYIKLNDLDLGELDIKKALEIDADNRDVKVEYKTLKQKVKEYNRKEAKFYGNMFAKMTKLCLVFCLSPVCVRIEKRHSFIGKWFYIQFSSKGNVT
ncbi:hypothetical protein QN277_029047 [Acacia crassicarpa]|uniref:Uncharacterized protein n=1 Tax=Acacia crassicarpa TaxID=499986 RepID=A0AAE1MJ31_9FABA|nr:hypothetical protein QN277_029047 [Acacia crassicarpa]